MAKSKLDTFLELKNSCSTKEASFDWWSNNSHREELGIISVNDNLKKISMRLDDHKESTAIYGNLGYVDFGQSNKKKDPVDRIMEVKSCSFSEALNIIYSWLSSDEIQPIRSNSSNNSNNSNNKKSEYPLNNNIVRECLLNKANFKERYDNLKYGLFRACTEAEISFAENILSIGFSPISKYDIEDRIFIPEFDENNNPWGFYKYNRSANGPKGLLRSNSKRVLFASHLLRKYPKDIIYAEGHTDVIVNVSKHYAAITTGSATKSFDSNINLLANKTLHDFPDLDLPGMIGAVNRGIEIDEFNRLNPDKLITHIIYWWSEWMYSEKLYSKIIENKVDTYESFYLIKDQIPLKYNRANFNVSLLSEIINIYAKKNKIILPPRLDIKNWKIMQKGACESGFDWIDFYQKHKIDEKVEKFLSKFKFK